MSEEKKEEKKKVVLTKAHRVILAAVIGFIVAVGLYFIISGSRRETFTLYTWAEMFPQEVLDGFEKANNVRINYVNFDYDETMLTMLETSQGGGYDLVIADDYIIETVIEKGLAQKLDKSKLSNFRNINPIYQRQFYDRTDEYTVPYGAGVQTIVYDPSQVLLNITGYADLWDSKIGRAHV